MKNSIYIICLMVLLFFGGILIAQTNAPSYKIVDRFQVEGDNGWDYLTVDSANGRVFVSHGNEVQVLDEKSGKLIGSISGTQGVHGISLAPDLNKGFTSDGRDNAVTVFNYKTLEIIKKIPVTGENPDAILYDSFSNLVLTFNGKSSNATVINAKDSRVVATIPLAGKPEFSTSDNKGYIYVNIEDKNLVSVIDTKTFKVIKSYSLAPGKNPTGITIDNENHRLFVSCNNKLMIIMDAQNGKIITALPIGEHVDGAAFDPVLKLAFASSGDGTLMVIQEIDKDTFKILENVETQRGARTIAIDTKTHHIFLPTAEFMPADKPTTENPKPRARIKPGSFIILDIAPVK